MLSLGLWQKGLIALAVAGALVGGYLAWEDHIDGIGYARANGEWEKKELAISAAAEAKYAGRLATALANSKSWQDEANKREAARLAEGEEHEKALAVAVGRARAGTERLSIRTVAAACPVPGDAKAGVPTAAGGAGPEERADILPGTAGDLVGVAGASARVVWDYNALLDEYHALRSSCTGEPSTPGITPN